MPNTIRIKGGHPISENLSTITVGDKTTCLEISDKNGARITGDLSVTDDIGCDIMASNTITTNTISGGGDGIEIQSEGDFRFNPSGSASDVTIDNRLVDSMVGQGKELLPEIEGALDDYFGDYEVLAVEMQLYEPIKTEEEYVFKGYIDAVVATPDKKVHIFDWKTCSWGWDAKRRSDKMTTYQLTLYKHFFAQKMGVDPKDIETHFALLKRTAKKNKVEFFRVTSGPRKTQNALKMLNTALHNIKKQRYIKNRLSCRNCNFRHTEQCP